MVNSLQLQQHYQQWTSLKRWLWILEFRLKRKCLHCQTQNPWIQQFHFWRIQIHYIDCFDSKLTGKWQFYDHFQLVFCQLYQHLSQNWGSDGHFEVLNGSKSNLVQKLWPNRKNAKIKARLTHQNLKLINGHFTTISGHFFANYVSIFHKTEIQTVILRCFMSLKLNWCKSYDAKWEKAENLNESFFTKSQQNGNGNICFLCHNLWTN